MSTLADLKADHANYLGIEVEDERARSQQSRAAGRSDYDFKQYSRGVVPSQQKSEFATNRDYYFEFEQGPNEANRKLGREIEQQHQLSSDNRPQESNRSQALRLQPQPAAQSRSASERLVEELHDQSALATRSPAAAPAADESFGGTTMGVARRAKQKILEKTETLQVLFVLTAGAEPDSSQPAAAKAIITPPAEEGLKT